MKTLVKGNIYRLAGHSHGVIFKGSHSFGATTIYNFKDVIGGESIQLTNIDKINK